MPSATQELRRRFLTLDPTDADTDTFELSFSSETPVARQYGDEVLSHAAGAVDLSRLNDSAPLLFNHNPDQLLGVVDSARVVGGKGRAQSHRPLGHLSRGCRETTGRCHWRPAQRLRWLSDQRDGSGRGRQLRRTELDTRGDLDGFRTQ